MPDQSWFIFPFILNSRGSAWNEPILSDNVLKFLNLDRVLDLNRKVPKIIQPFGIIQKPLYFEWDEENSLNVPQNDLRFNMLGSILVTSITTIQFFVRR